MQLPTFNLTYITWQYVFFCLTFVLSAGAFSVT